MVSDIKWRECFIHFQKTEIVTYNGKKHTTSVITYSMGQISSECVTDLNIADKL